MDEEQCLSNSRARSVLEVPSYLSKGIGQAGETIEGISQFGNGNT